jgi:hypothetical protein
LADRLTSASDRFCGGSGSGDGDKESGRPSLARQCLPGSGDESGSVRPGDRGVDMGRRQGSCRNHRNGRTEILCLDAAPPHCSCTNKRPLAGQVSCRATRNVNYIIASCKAVLAHCARHALRRRAHLLEHRGDGTGACVQEPVVVDPQHLAATRVGYGSGMHTSGNGRNAHAGPRKNSYPWPEARKGVCAAQKGEDITYPKISNPLAQAHRMPVKSREKWARECQCKGA